MIKPCILVVEDEALVARDIADILRKAEMEVVGPVGTVNAALAKLESLEFDAALLDINLHGVPCFPVAAALRQRAIPFAFVTGYGPIIVPVEFRDIPHFGKPITAGAVVSLVRELCKA